MGLSLYFFFIDFWKDRRERMRGNDKQEVFCGGLSSMPLQPFNSNQLYVYSCLKVLHIVN